MPVPPATLPVMRIITATSAAVALMATVCLADANVEQKTQFHLSGAAGAILNTFSRTAREGATNTTIVKGNRKLTRTGDAGEIVDLGEEKVYTIDFARKTYSVKTFDDLRREYEEAQERSRKNEERSAERSEKSGEKAPEYEVDFDVKSTGNKETINDFNTHEEIVTVTVHEKGKPIEKSGGWILTTDMWMGPKIAAMREIAEFNRRFAQKVYGSMMPDAHQIAMAMASTPAFAKAMKVFGEKRGSLEGTAIRTNMKFDTVTGTDPSTQDQQQQQSASPVGGFLSKMRDRRKADSGDANRATLFDSTTEVLRASDHASREDVSIPADFRAR